MKIYLDIGLGGDRAVLEALHGLLGRWERDGYIESATILLDDEAVGSAVVDWTAE